MGNGNTKKLERIQKIFLKYLFKKNFHYYDASISYEELFLGYELTSLEVRRELSLIILIRDVLTGKTDSPCLLSNIGFFAPSRPGRARDLFYIPRHRTTSHESSPLFRALQSFNRILKLDTTIDIFFGHRTLFINKAVGVLQQIHCL